MNDTKNIRAYWLLLTGLCGCFAWLKWIMLAGIGIILLGIPIYGVWHSLLGFIIGGSVIFLVICMSTVFLPNQMLAINSSKQIGFLSNIRSASFIIFLLMCLLVSFMVAAMFSLKQGQVSIHSFFPSFFLISIVLIGNIVAVQKYPWLQSLVFFFLWAVAPVFRWLTEIYWAGLLIGGLALWIAFYYHWKNWKPIRCHQNIFGMSYNQLLAFNKQRTVQSTLWFEKIFSVKAVSLVDSILLGRADGWSAKARSASGIFLGLIVLVSIFSVIFGSGSSKFQIISSIIYPMYLVIANGLIMYFFQNMNKAWLYFPGTRSSFFYTLERVYYSWMCVMGVPVVIVHIGIVYFLLDRQLYGDLVWVTAAFAIVVLATIFYMSLFIYHRTKGSWRWQTWFNIVFMLVLAIPVILYNLMWAEHSEKIIDWAYFFMAGSVLGILVLRHRIKSKWASVDFVKVKS